jgi:glutamate racemase
MKIGIFDSGIGGLLVTRAIVKKLPQYDYIYLGDTHRVPYGNRSEEAIYQFTREGIEYLFKKNCQLIIVACNTASARALRRIQQDYLPKNYPDRRVLGVIIPTVEYLAEYIDTKRIRVGVLATLATVKSKAFPKELKKISPQVRVFQQPAPLLVPLIENNGLKRINPILKEYVQQLLKNRVKAIILGCTHYSLLKGSLRKMFGQKVKIVSQDEIVPAKLKNYLQRHPEIENKLSKKNKRAFLVTDLTSQVDKLAKQWFGKNIKLKKVIL